MAMACLTIDQYTFRCMFNRRCSISSSGALILIRVVCTYILVHECMGSVTSEGYVSTRLLSGQSVVRVHVLHRVTRIAYSMCGVIHTACTAVV
jgi:hypothetical protein